MFSLCFPLLIFRCLPNCRRCVELFIQLLVSYKRSGSILDVVLAFSYYCMTKTPVANFRLICGASKFVVILDQLDYFLHCISLSRRELLRQSISFLLQRYPAVTEENQILMKKSQLSATTFFQLNLSKWSRNEIVCCECYHSLI